MTEKAKKTYEKLFNGQENPLTKTDPELVDYFTNFAYDEVVDTDQLDEHTRLIATLAVLMGNQGIDLYKRMLIAAYNAGVTVVEMKEIAYQAADYLGMGKAYPYLFAINDFCKENAIEIPMEARSTTNTETRLMAGNQKQVDYFGERNKEGWLHCAPERKPITIYLADNCFGDVYTRVGLTDNQREMITFCFLIAQGGCEPQAIAHAKANMNIGNTKEFLYQVVNQVIPFIGYPRSLNALSNIDTASKM